MIFHEVVDKFSQDRSRNISWRMKFLGGIVRSFMAVKATYKGNLVEFARPTKIFGCIINKIPVDDGPRVSPIKFVDDTLSAFASKTVHHSFTTGRITAKFPRSDVRLVDGFFHRIKSKW